MYIYVKKRGGGVFYIFLVIDKTSDICAYALRLALMIDVNMYTFILMILLFGVFSLKKEKDSHTFSTQCQLLLCLCKLHELRHRAHDVTLM